VTRLAAMAPDCADPRAAGVEIEGLAIDHRKVAQGTLFGAFPGTRFNGEDFIAAAEDAGAVAIVARPEAHVTRAIHIADAEPRRRFAAIAARYFDRMPAHVVAVTGTNGKTSTVEMARQLWRMLGHHAASIGTLGVTTADEQVKTGLTTPDIVTFLSNLSGLAAEGVSHVAYEASSHGLDQHRCEGVPLVAAAFTNLSRDHLDYHADMDAYFAAKMRLFDELLDAQGTAVIWADDAWSARVSDHARARGVAIFSIGQAGQGIRLIDRTPTPLGQLLTLALGEAAPIRVTLPLIGAYQAANALVAAGLVITAGEEPARVFDALARLQPVRGRLERVAICKAGAPVYIDYAHTPDAISAALTAIKPHAAGRIILVLGAGGDRDPGKRGPMGAAAVAGADVVIVTDDNPRGEDPVAIRSAILTEAPGARDIADRRAAIAAAIAEAGSGDIIIIAGKGHETGQIIGRGADERILPFDDAVVAREEAGR
jgi:UDP-N-acetylmuramoyl-L-alanyl-D-glutamate--2,6-diaminopimelate ligase